MPQTKSAPKSKIPTITRTRHSKKSLSENIKPNEVTKKSSKTTRSKQITTAAAPDGPKRRHLSVVDINTRDGSKSSISDVESDIFYTADKGEKIDEGSLDGKIFYESSFEEIISKKSRNSKPTQKENASLNPKDVVQTTTSSTKSSSILLEIKLEEDQRELLPDGVINIEVDDGLYEYSREVVVYLKKLEISTTVPSTYLDDGSVTSNMRSILVDWLIQVQHHLKLCQETLYLGVGILDLVMHRRDVDPDKLQLVGITALLVASKLEEYYPVDIKKLLHLTENSYTRVEVTHMERVLFEVLDFQVYLPSPQVFLLRYVRAALRSEDPQFLKTCQYLLDSHLTNSSHASLPPSITAAAAVLASCLLYNLSNNHLTPSSSSIWTPTLVHYTTCNLSYLASVARDMVDQVLAAVLGTSKFTGATVKYKSLSQHQRLALAHHLQADVLRRGERVLDEWTM